MAGVLGYKKATDAPPITPQDLWLVIDAWTTLSGVRSCEEFLWELEESDIRNSVEVHKRISTLPVKAFRWCDSPLFFHQSSGQELLPSWLCTHTHQSQAQLCTKRLSLPLNKDLRKSLSLLKCPDLFNNILMGYFNSNIYFCYNENVLQVVVQIHWLSWEEITTYWGARAQPLRSRMLARVSPSLLTL